MTRSRRKTFSRTERVGELIQEALAVILERERIDSSADIITITGVQISPDFSFAKVFVSVLNDENAKETVSHLNQQVKYLRFVLAKEVKLRIIPDLKFIYDDAAARGERIDTLINKI